MADFSKIAVLGSGSWATALVKILCENNTNVGWYMHNETIYEHLQEEGHNPNYLSSVEFDLNRLSLYTCLNEIAGDYDVFIIAIPSFYLDSSLESLTTSIENKIIFSAVKGIVPERKMLVDIGSGSGRDLIFSARRGWYVDTGRPRTFPSLSLSRLSLTHERTRAGSFAAWTSWQSIAIRFRI